MGNEDESIIMVVLRSTPALF